MTLNDRDVFNDGVRVLVTIRGVSSHRRIRG
jgi:hypothetical protein